MTYPIRRRSGDRVDVGDVLVAEQDPARGRLDQPVDHPQDGGLAAAGRPDQDDQLAGRHVEGQVADGDGAVGVHLADALEPDRRRGGSVHPCPLWSVGPRPSRPTTRATRGSRGSTSARTSTLSPPRCEQHVALTLAAVGDRRADRRSRWRSLAYQVRWLAGPILGITGVLYTIPSLALFALLGPILGLSFSTVLIGLVLYALLAIVRNALTGLRQVPAEVRDAAAGHGVRPARSAVAGRAAAGAARHPDRAAASPPSPRWPWSRSARWSASAASATLILTGFNNNFYKPQIIDRHDRLRRARAHPRPDPARRSAGWSCRGPGGGRREPS